MKLRKKTPNGAMGVIIGENLGPLVEGPVPESQEDDDYDDKVEGSWSNMTCWMKGSKRRPTNSRLLLSILGCALTPVAVSSQPLSPLSIKDVPIEASSAQYIVQQYVAATGATKLQSSVQNSYIMGKVKMMVSQFETSTKSLKVPMKSAENGWFTIWKMMPDKWHMELALEGNMVQAGSNGKLMWGCTPWLGAHAVKGPIRPLRRSLQGLDPLMTANIFGNAWCIGEKRIQDEDCFVLKLAADPSTLSDSGDGPSDFVRHALFGYFSQRTGLLVYLKDTHLTRMHVDGTKTEYWETTFETSLKDYKAIDGVTLSHAGQSVVTLLRLTDDAMTRQRRRRIEETWSIEEVAFNVHGLSQEFFIPPAGICLENLKDESHLPLRNDVAESRG